MMGTPTSYDHVPYFFSDQYDCGMEYSGYVPPDVTTRSSSAATWPAASSSPSGCATGGCWPA